MKSQPTYTLPRRQHHPKTALPFLTADYADGADGPNFSYLYPRYRRHPRSITPSPESCPDARRSRPVQTESSLLEREIIGLRQRQRKHRARAAARAIFQCHFATVQTGDLVHDA